jgi:hypothetical protein
LPAFISGIALTAIDFQRLCSHFVLMVKTLGEAWKLGWRAKAHCIWFGPNKDGKRRVPWCDTTTELDMKTLVWTRGERMPLELLRERLRCPKCGRTNVLVFFEVPNQPKAKRAAG